MIQVKWTGFGQSARFELEIRIIPVQVFVQLLQYVVQYPCISSQYDSHVAKLCKKKLASHIKHASAGQTKQWASLQTDCMKNKKKNLFFELMSQISGFYKLFIGGFSFRFFFFWMLVNHLELNILFIRCCSIPWHWLDSSAKSLKYPLLMLQKTHDQFRSV